MVRFIAIIAALPERLRVLDQIITGKKHIRSIGVSYPICRTHLSGIFSILCGARGLFPAAVAMLMVLVLFSYNRSEEVLNPPYVVGLNI
jgi:hypothetical protein